MKHCIIIISITIIIAEQEARQVDRLDLEIDDVIRMRNELVINTVHACSHNTVEKLLIFFGGGGKFYLSPLPQEKKAKKKRPGDEANHGAT